MLPSRCIPSRVLTRYSLEPLGVLVFSIVMVTSFCQVALEAIQRLMSPDHEIVQLYVSLAPQFSQIRNANVAGTKAAFRPSPLWLVPW